MLDFIRSPCCRAPLSEKDNQLKCSACPNAYPIREGIPVLLPHEAQQRCMSCNDLKPSEEMRQERCKICIDNTKHGLER